MTKHDQADEAERLGVIYTECWSQPSPSNEAFEALKHAFVKGYRAGVASKAQEIQALNLKLINIYNMSNGEVKEGGIALHRLNHEMDLRDKKLTDLREENERLKDFLHYETLAAERAVKNHDECFKKYQAEKLKSQKLVEALKYYANNCPEQNRDGEWLSSLPFSISSCAEAALAAYANNESGNEG